VIGDLAGTASAIKCFRSIYMKGAAALLFETCLAARRYGAADLIVESLSESFNSVPFETWVDRLLNGTAIHAERRMHEMDDVIETLQQLRMSAVMSLATRHVLSSIASMDLSERFGGKTPQNYAEVLAAMEAGAKDVAK
jgi:3-hydroxyisobutyrate dehydrogenase-like beta-hydroxyacid dehydrogenase